MLYFFSAFLCAACTGIEVATHRWVWAAIWTVFTISEGYNALRLKRRTLTELWRGIYIALGLLNVVWAVLGFVAHDVAHGTEAAICAVLMWLFVLQSRASDLAKAE